MFKYLNSYQCFSLRNNDLLEIRLSPHLVGEGELMKEYSEKLNFPEYFGHNWDALWDCMCDLSWINEHNLIIIHSDLPLLDEKALKIYVNILEDFQVRWDKRGDKSVEIYFNEENRQVINLIVSRSK